MRVLVTGLDGFTGVYVQAELERHGHSVIGLSADLTDAVAVAKEVKQIKPEAVIHLAAIAFVGHGNSNDFYQVNLIGTSNLLQALAEHVPDISSILLVSSANVYGNRSEGILAEDQAPDPINDYAVSKYAMELMARIWSPRLPLFIVRPFNYTGVGQQTNFLVPKIVSHFQQKRSIIELGNLEVWRDYNDVRSVATTYRLLLESPPIGQTLNVCSGTSYSLNDIVSLCQEISGHSIDIVVNPEFVRANEVKMLAGDNGLLHKAIGQWQTYSLSQTLSWMLQADSADS